MANIVTIECFVGFHHLADNCYGESRLQSFIDRYEDYYLCSLLGAELYPLFIDDLVGGVPSNPDYLSWFNPFCEDIDGKCCLTETVNSKGLKDMLTGFIYYHYVHQSQMRQTQTGTTVSKSHNSTNVGMINNERDAESRYNESVESYNAISLKIGNCKKLDYKFLDLI